MTEAEQSVLAIATMDTKGEEIAWVAKCLRSVGVVVHTVDVGTLHDPTVAADIPRESLFAPLGMSGDQLRNMDRGQAVSAMSHALTTLVCERAAAGVLQGVIGIGGSGGTALVTQAMRALPIGLPKLMVSTVASGNTSAYVDCSDICMMHSVVDVAGLNSVSVRVLANAAHAMAGMVLNRVPPTQSKRTVGMTMFGVTTPCVSNVRKQLAELGFDCLIFHATGAGGRAMEKLVESGLIEGVLDITTTEVADEIAGGIFPAGPNRFDAIVQREIPFVLSLGALDMVNFGSLDLVPERYRQRKLHSHNAQVTLMRTTPDENVLAARWIAGKLNSLKSPAVFLIPERGVSALDHPDQPFFDPRADAALFDELEKSLAANQNCRVVRTPFHINDPGFADELVTAFLQCARPRRPETRVQ